MQLTTTDPGLNGYLPSLPGSYTFTGAGSGKDNGTHTFSGVSLVSAGSATITASGISEPGDHSSFPAAHRPVGAQVSEVVEVVLLKLLDRFADQVGERHQGIDAALEGADVVVHGLGAEQFTLESDVVGQGPGGQV